MAYANVNDVKQILTEKGPIENGKVALYCQMADNFIDVDLTGTSEPVVPLTVVPKVVANMATALACAYFYKFESGDTVTAEQAEETWNKYFIRKYRSPKFAISNKK